ncbi:MAG: hypothetical protein JSS81_13160 [Acidobacteria bacterium]|nr:hypothetical protein [Acidobacteriota bacterium]
MIFYQLDYVVEEVLKNTPSPEQLRLRKYLNRDFPQNEAKYLWGRIVDHKWYVGERLRRDVGFRVAAIDYFENFYEPQNLSKTKPGAWRRILGPLNSISDFGFRISD